MRSEAKRGTSKLKSFVAEEIIIVYSDEIIEEYRAAVQKEKIGQASHFSWEERLHFVWHFERFGERIHRVSNFKICRDPEDDKFLNCAIDGEADYIILRDFDLLVLKRFHGIPIVSDKEFLEILKLYK